MLCVSLWLFSPLGVIDFRGVGGTRISAHKRESNKTHFVVYRFFTTGTREKNAQPCSKPPVPCLHVLVCSFVSDAQNKVEPESILVQYRQKRLAFVDTRGLNDDVFLQGSHHHSYLLVLPNMQDTSIEK